MQTGQNGEYVLTEKEKTFKKLENGTRKKWKIKF